jgi:hypothetical protein
MMLLHGWAQAGVHGPMPGQSLAALHDNGFMRHIMSWSQRLAPAQWGMPVLTLAIWVALGWSGSAWVLRALQPPPEAQGFAYATTGVAQSVATGSALVGPEAARLMGAPATTGVEVVAAPNLASRLKLVGVASAGAQRGAALIGIDGQAPKPYQIGREVVDGLVLQSVDRLGARLGAQVRGPSALQLDMPLPRQP